MTNLKGFIETDPRRGETHSLLAVVVSSISIRISVAVGMAVVSTVQEVGISLGLSISGPLAVVCKGGDDGGVLVDDGLAESVGDDGAGANSQGALAGVVDLGVEGGGSEDGGDLVDGSLQVTVVTGNGLLASDSDGDSSVGGNNVGLDGGGVGLVGDGLGGGDHGRGSVGKSIGVADNRGDNSGVGISRPLAVVSVPVGVAVSVSEMSVVSSVQQVGISISFGLGLSISRPLSVVVASIGVAVAIAIA